MMIVWPHDDYIYRMKLSLIDRRIDLIMRLITISLCKNRINTNISKLKAKNQKIIYNFTFLNAYIYY